jgi:cellulose synthase/poly-beta-1,6-N-acetylglucosamine synthase-like glycosyltransferase
MNYFHWIAGCALGLAWLWRLADAALGVPKIADISTPAWDRKPPDEPRISIIVPACNEAPDIEATLTRLLALDYNNYEVIAVDDRSTDDTGAIMDRVAAGASCRMDGQAARHVERRQPGEWRLAAFYRR